jgi:hypothetical protein
VIVIWSSTAQKHTQSGVLMLQKGRTQTGLKRAIPSWTPVGARRYAANQQFRDVVVVGSLSGKRSGTNWRRLDGSGGRDWRHLVGERHDI